MFLEKINSTYLLLINSNNIINYTSCSSIGFEDGLRSESFFVNNDIIINYIIFKFKTSITVVHSTPTTFRQGGTHLSTLFPILLHYSRKKFKSRSTVFFLQPAYYCTFYFVPIYTLSYHYR